MYISMNDNSQQFWLDGEEIVSKNGKSYELTDRIGSGGNGAVYECIDTTGTQHAVKFLLHSSKKNSRRFEQEVSLLKKLKHPHIIRYIDDGMVELTKISNRTSHTFNVNFVVMEKADENLIDFLKKHGSLGYETYAAQFRGLCAALEELHRHAIHRDIKPENILIKGDTWVLSDFGLCEFLDPAEHQDITRPNEKVGPAFWMSPEAIDSYYWGYDSIGTYSDVFQLCSVFAFVLMRKHPGGILSSQNNFDTTPSLKKLIIDSLSNDYTNRPIDGHALIQRYNEATFEA